MMTLTEIERTLRALRLSGIAATLNTRVMEAQATQQPFLETLSAMLQDELDRRRSRLTSTGASTPSCRARPASSCTR